MPGDNRIRLEKDIEFMRAVSLALSLLTHLAVILLALHSPIADLFHPDMAQSSYEVELVDLPDQPAVEETVSERSANHPSQTPQTDISSSKQSPPPPRQAVTPSQPPEAEPRQASPPQAADSPAPPPPQLPPGTAAVSPMKRSTLRGSWQTEIKEKHNGTKSAGLVLEQGVHLTLGDSNETVVIKTGAESRPLRALAARDFGVTDYKGHYQITENWYLDIFDARQVHGSMIFYDSDSGLYRMLSQFGKMIYTYGETFTDTSSVHGSITFLATKEGITNRDVLWNNRVLWMDENDRLARFGTKVYFQDEPVRFQSGMFFLSGRLILPLDGGPYPAVVLALGEQCLPLEFMAGFARILSRHGVAVLIVQPVGCGESSQLFWERSLQEKGRDLLAAVDLLRQRVEIDKARIGLLALDRGIASALEAAATSQDVNFIITAMTETGWPRGGSDVLVGFDQIARVIPMLCMFSGKNPETRWRDVLEQIKAVSQRTGFPEVTTFDAEDPRVFPGTKAHVEDPWVYRFSPRFMDTAGNWISSR